jgi:hypothetical protein
MRRTIMKGEPVINQLYQVRAKTQLCQLEVVNKL